MRRFRYPLIVALCLAVALPMVALAIPQFGAHAASKPAKAQPHLFRSAHASAHAASVPYGSTDLTYYGGPVQRNPRIFLIFWGSSWSSGSALNSVGQVVSNYFHDMSGTRFDSVLSQYTDANGNAIANTSTFGGSWIDTTNPVNDTNACSGGSGANTGITDTDIQTEAAHAISVNSWPTDHTNSLYMVFSPSGTTVYAGTYGGVPECSYSVFCGYHSYSGSFQAGFAYAIINYTDNVRCQGPDTGPNGAIADTLVSVASHEQFETITDPFPDGPGATGLTGWVAPDNNEIGDKCAWYYGDPPSTTSTTLSNGHSYLLQWEYSNAVHDCVNKALPFTTTGVFRPSNGRLYLKNANTSGNADLSISYGLAGDQPITGDWTGKGYNSIGVYRNATFFLRNTNTTGTANIVVHFGIAGDIPVAGDWTGKGYDSIGVYRPANSTFYLRDSNTAGPPDHTVHLGLNGDVPIVGDWIGQGKDTVGVFRPSNGIVFLRNSNTSGNADAHFVYGIAGDKPVVGDWTGKGYDTVGIYRNGKFMLRNSNTTGPANITFVLGIAGDVPIAGPWTLPASV